MKIKDIEWSEELDPNDKCGYNHVIGKSPLGQFLITWKGWKDQPEYCIENDRFPEMIESYYSIHAAKCACYSFVFELIHECIIEE